MLVRDMWSAMYHAMRSAKEKTYRAFSAEELFDYVPILRTGKKGAICRKIGYSWSIACMTTRRLEAGPRTVIDIRYTFEINGDHLLYKQSPPQVLSSSESVQCAARRTESQESRRIETFQHLHQQLIRQAGEQPRRILCADC